MSAIPIPQLTAKKSSRQEFLDTLKYFFSSQLFFILMMLSFSFGGKNIFGVIIAIPPLLALSTGRKKGYIFILYFICATFVIGQRTFYLGPSVRLVPSEVLFWMLGLGCLIIRATLPLKKSGFPVSAVLLFIASLIAVWIAALNDRDVNSAFAYGKGMLLALPTFFVCRQLINKTKQVDDIVFLLAMASLFLSFLGVAEYFGMPFIKYFSGFVSMDTETLMTAQGFKRITATFWGGPTVAIVIALFLPLILCQWFVSKSFIQKVLLGASILLSTMLIYYSGYRGIWVATALAVFCYLYLKGIKGIILLILIVVLSAPFVSDVARARFGSVYGETRDNSSIEREMRARGTLELIKANPWTGHGWGAAGLAHTDLLQIWSDMGLFGVLSFAGLYFGVLIKLFLARMRIKKSNKVAREHINAFIGTLVGYLVILFCETLLNLPEQYPPFWMVMALAYYYPNLCIYEQNLSLQMIAAERAAYQNRASNA